MSRTIFINPQIVLKDSHWEERFIRAPGPGGQHVNKVASAVQLRFDAARSPALPEPVRQRLLRLAGRRLGKDGFITLEAHGFRERERNREAARQRLISLIRAACRAPKPRKKRRPNPHLREQRLAAKRHRSQRKRWRAPVFPEA